MELKFEAGSRFGIDTILEIDANINLNYLSVLDDIKKIDGVYNAYIDSQNKYQMTVLMGKLFDKEEIKKKVLKILYSSKRLPVYTDDQIKGFSWKPLWK